MTESIENFKLKLCYYLILVVNKIFVVYTITIWRKGSWYFDVFIITKNILYVDKNRAEIPANIGFEDGCQKSLYTLTNDGTIYAEWTDEYPFEIGHFLWSWDFPMRDMIVDESRILVNGKESPYFINELLVDGYHYRAEFTSKEYDSTKDTDFMPPDL